MVRATGTLSIKPVFAAASRRSVLISLVRTLVEPAGRPALLSPFWNLFLGLGLPLLILGFSFFFPYYMEKAATRACDNCTSRSFACGANCLRSVLGRYAVEFYTTVKTAYVYPGSPSASEALPVRPKSRPRNNVDWACISKQSYVGQGDALSDEPLPA